MLIASQAELVEMLAHYQIRPAVIGALDPHKDRKSGKITLEFIAKFLL